MSSHTLWLKQFLKNSLLHSLSLSHKYFFLCLTCFSASIADRQSPKCLHVTLPASQWPKHKLESVLFLYLYVVCLYLSVCLFLSVGLSVSSNLEGLHVSGFFLFLWKMYVLLSLWDAKARAEPESEEETWRRNRDI